jgi:hypothetical protein
LPWGNSIPEVKAVIPEVKSAKMTTGIKKCRGLMPAAFNARISLSLISRVNDRITARELAKGIEKRNNPGRR